MKQIDFLSIGDITVDDFIRLKAAHVHNQQSEPAAELCLTFGDKIEYEFRKLVLAVANSANAAVSAARLGLTTAFVTDAGNDESGRACKTELERNGIDTRYMRLHDHMETNYHYVLWYGVERTILVKHHEYPYTLPNDLAEPRWIYLSSIGGGGNSAAYHQEIANYLTLHPNVKMAFQPGTFQMRMGTNALSDIYKRAEVTFCNKEESQRILNTEENDIKKLLAGMRNLGSKMAVITDGAQGAYLSYDEGDYFMPIYSGDVYERTGAGDAFSSTFASALALGKTPLEALAWGPINSMSVVMKIGAQEGLLTRPQLEDYLSKAPANYTATKI